MLGLQSRRSFVAAVSSATSATSRRPGQAASICAASLSPPYGDQPVKTTTRGRRRSASSAACSSRRTQRVVRR